MAVTDPWTQINFFGLQKCSKYLDDISEYVIHWGQVSSPKTAILFSIFHSCLNSLQFAFHCQPSSKVAFIRGKSKGLFSVLFLIISLQEVTSLVTSLAESLYFTRSYIIL